MFKPIRSGLNLAIAATLAGVGAGCTFSGVPGPPSPNYINSMWERASLAQPYATNRRTVYDDDLFQVQHGASCARADSAVSVDNAGTYVYGIGINESIPIPAAYDTATVFLNGWQLKYRGEDHEVLGLSTAIVDIAQEDDTLRWKAGGILSDQNGDDEFAWCYYYTALLWKSHTFNLDATPNHSDEGAGLTFVSLGAPGQTSSYYVQTNLLEDFSDVPGALLPRGFGAAWDHRGYTDAHDHHLQQLALKYGDPFTSTSEDGSGTDLFWQFETVFKDRGYRDYYAAEVISTLNGDSVDVIQPDFDIYPGQQNGSPGYHDVIAQTIVVDDVPYDYAVPMLTGWDIGLNSNSDSHIRDIGVWIESFDYAKDAGATTGTLTYTIKSVFHDDGANGAGAPHYQVSILGLNPKGIIVQNPTTGTIKEDPLPTPTTTSKPASTTGTVGGFDSGVSRFGTQTTTGSLR